MIMRREDENGDFVFGHSMSDYLTENAAIALLLENRLMLWLGEWFLDISAGIDWPAILGSKPAALRLVEAEVRACASATEGVERIDNLQISIDHRTFTVDMYFEITTEYSTGVIVQFSHSIQAALS
jgi:hypothetical protein